MCLDLLPQWVLPIWEHIADQFVRDNRHILFSLDVLFADKAAVHHGQVVGVLVASIDAADRNVCVQVSILDLAASHALSAADRLDHLAVIGLKLVDHLVADKVLLVHGDR